MEDLTKISSYLAQNITELRKRKNYSQLQLADLADIPRTTLTNIESGLGNPSLTNVIKISTALRVGIEELLSRPRTECQVINASDVPVLIRGGGRVKVFKLLPDKLKGIAIERMEFEPESTLPGHPHLTGTKEYLTVLKGEVAVHLSGDIFNIKKGDVLAFPGNQPHSYRNPKKNTSMAISVVIPIPPSTV